jgi:23S rRNA-/tRNA-specific pseudouridylate synthase
LVKHIKVTSFGDETRIDRWLKRTFSSLNQGFIEKNLRKGFIKVKNKKVKASYRVKKDDIVNIYNFSKDTYFNILQKVPTKKIPIGTTKQFQDSIVFENNEFIILDKWHDIVTQGGSKIDVSINDIIKKISLNYNLVHRLDKETSGLLIISKNLEATKIFATLFRNREIEKIYIAVCLGMPKNINSTVKLEIQNKNNLQKNSFSITKYKVILKKNKFSVILFKPLTGKTHQLRIVSKNIASPIVGDSKYNLYEKNTFEKLKLNAFFLKFTLKGKEYEFESKLPRHFIEFFRKERIKFKINKNFFNF